MNYVETVKYALDAVRIKNEFYVDLPGFDKPARIHIVVNNIAGTRWYDATSEVCKSDRFVPVGRYSANDLFEFKHIVGLCWVSIQNHARQSLDNKINSAAAQAAEIRSTDKNLAKETTPDR